MKVLKLTVMCCALGLFTGCGQTEELDSMEEDLEMSLVASIEGSSSSTMGSRYAGTAPNDIAFVDGDAIGLSVNSASFVKWDFGGNAMNWTPAQTSVYWNDKTSEHVFEAFYPYAANASRDNVPMPDLSGQTGDMKSIAEKDFLVATKEQTYGTDGVVSFTDGYAFKHVSSLVILTLKGEGELASATINAISIGGTDLLTPTTYSFEEDEVVLDSDESKSSNLLAIEPSHLMESKNVTFYFVLNSGTVELSAITLKIDYTTSNGNYEAVLNGLESNNVDSFESGKQYSYSLKVSGGQLIVSGNTIQDWENGLSLDDIVINGTGK